MDRIESRRLFLSLVACWGVSVGCGEPEPLSQVSGTVTLGGAPLEEGEVTFFSDAGSTGTGAIGPGGLYRLSNAKRQLGIDPGQYTAVVMPSLGQIKKAHGDPMVRVKTNEIPPVYTSSGTSPLKYTVVEGENTIDITLEKTPPKR